MSVISRYEMFNSVAFLNTLCETRECFSLLLSAFPRSYSLYCNIERGRNLSYILRKSILDSVRQLSLIYSDTFVIVQKHPLDVLKSAVES